MACFVGLTKLFAYVTKPSRDQLCDDRAVKRDLCKWKKIMLGRYEIDMSQGGVLGEGSSCICRMGRIKETGELVAIKVYKDTDVACLTRHRRFVAVLENLQEPFQQPSDPLLWSSQLENVKPAELFMRLLDYSKDENGQPGYDSADGNLYVITELGQQSLKDYIDQQREERAPPSKETVRSIAHAIILVIAGLHAKGFVHLDVKPENLMVFNGCLKLIDVDGCVEIGTLISPHDHSISFSPAYCAPEWGRFLLRGKKACQFHASPGLDVWSCGCIISELVTLDAIFVSAYTKATKKGFKDQKDIVAFMKWMARLDHVSMPRTVQQFYPELSELIAGSLLVLPASQRKTCAESLGTALFASQKLGHRHANPTQVPALAMIPQATQTSEFAT